MNKRYLYFYFTLSISICTIILLITGSDLLTMALDAKNSIPLGTWITWAGMISLPLTVYWGIIEFRKPTKKLNKILSRLLKTTITLGVLWLPISFFLAGNLSFTFSEKLSFQGGQAAMRWFWRLSYGIAITTVMILATYWLSILKKKIKYLFLSK